MIMKLKNSPKGANWGDQSKEGNPREGEKGTLWLGLSISGPHFEKACRGRKNFLQSQTPPRSSTG